jgi:hypothetical protein
MEIGLQAASHGVQQIVFSHRMTLFRGRKPLIQKQFLHQCLSRWTNWKVAIELFSRVAITRN